MVSNRKLEACATTRTMPDYTLVTSQRFCRLVARRHARSFYFASWALPAEKKAAAYAVYAFCRHADDVMDRSPDPARAPEVLRALRGELARFFEGEGGKHPFAPAFIEAIGRYQIPHEPFLELLEGVGRDEGRVRMANWEELRGYCYQVASVVGLIMARIFEMQSDTAQAHAIDLGIAMQLTNILRDVGEDLANDRIYLPADELARFGISEVELKAGEISTAFLEMMKFQIDRSRAYYRQSEAGIPMLADDGSQYTVWLMRTIYAGILSEIERNHYDVFRRRATTSLPRKLRLAARAWADYRSHRR